MSNLALVLDSIVTDT